MGLSALSCYDGWPGKPRSFHLVPELCPDLILGVQMYYWLVVGIQQTGGGLPFVVPSPESRHIGHGRRRCIPSRVTRRMARENDTLHREKKNSLGLENRKSCLHPGWADKSNDARSQSQAFSFLTKMARLCFPHRSRHLVREHAVACSTTWQSRPVQPYQGPVPSPRRKKAGWRSVIFPPEV